MICLALAVAVNLEESLALISFFAPLFRANAGLPLLGFAAIGAMWLHMHRGRSAAVALLFAASYIFLVDPFWEMGWTLPLPPWVRVQSVITALPLSLVICQLSREVTGWGRKFVALCLFASLPLIAVYYGAMTYPEKFAEIAAWRFLPDTFPMAAHLPGAAWISSLIFILAVSINVDDRWKTYALASIAVLPLIMSASELMLAGEIVKSGADAALLFYGFAMVIHGHCLAVSLKRKVFLDDATGIPNRRALNERLNSLEGPYTLAMVDVDHFKRFNDTYGHEEGDNVLRMVAAVLKRESHDRAYRYGGEEFVVVIPGSLSYQNVDLFEDICKAVSSRTFVIRSLTNHRKRNLFQMLTGKFRNYLYEDTNQLAQITLSIGVACSDFEGYTSMRVLKRADESLYAAKRGGRNRVMIDDRIDFIEDCGDKAAKSVLSSLDNDLGEGDEEPFLDDEDFENSNDDRGRFAKVKKAV